jgi:CheY-like chemotaxis protein
MTKILLVEDDKSLREIYGVRLLAEGYDIVSAGDGEEALAMAIKERPQLIVSDVMMPKISGFDMLDILRSTTETKDIKVIMMTALSSEDQRARGEALGADRYLVKSQVGIEDVVRTVHDVLADAPVSGPANAPTFGGYNHPTAASAGTRPAPAPAVPARPAPVVAPQQPVVAPAAPQPVAQSAPTPVAPQPSFSAPQPAPASNLPRPTAPFSTTRPANLGDRVIHPITPVVTNKPDLASLMDQELNANSQPAPQPPVTPPTAPQLPPAPVINNPITQQPVAPQPPQPEVPGIAFEETPRPPVTQPSNPNMSGPQPPTMS